MSQPFKSDHMQNKRYQNEWKQERLDHLKSTTRTTHGVTIPVNIEIEADQKIFDFKSIKKILRKAEKFALKDCGCRNTRKNCDAPKAVCLYLDKYADEIVEADKNNPRYVSYEEALEALSLSHKAGLVHMSYTMGDDSYPTNICSCCTCCCWVLSGLLRFGMNLPIVTSDKIAFDNVEQCKDCGICIDRCQFDAREIIDGKVVYHPERCFGCGLCTSTCPTQAINLINRN